MIRCSCAENKDGIYKCQGRCGCAKAGQKCTELCKCKGSCKQYINMGLSPFIDKCSENLVQFDEEIDIEIEEKLSILLEFEDVDDDIELIR